KSAMRSEAAAISERRDLVVAASEKDPAAARRVLAEIFQKHPSLVSLSVVRGDRRVASVDRGRPLDEAKENSLEVRRVLGREVDDEDEDDAPALIAVFAADKARTDGLEDMSKFVDIYKNVASRRKNDQRTYLVAFVATLCVTIIGSIGVGILLARS